MVRVPWRDEPQRRGHAAHRQRPCLRKGGSTSDGSSASRPGDHLPFDGGAKGGAQPSAFKGKWDSDAAGWGPVPPWMDMDWSLGPFGKGAMGAWGSPGDMPAFPAAAPALLGFDTSIWEFCSHQAGLGTGGFEQHELAKRCVDTNNNILRMLRSEWPWSAYLCAGRSYP